MKYSRNIINFLHICEDWIRIRLDGRGREGDYVWIGLRLHGHIDGRGFDRTKFTWIGVSL